MNLVWLYAAYRLSSPAYLPSFVRSGEPKVVKGTLVSMVQPQSTCAVLADHRLTNQIQITDHRGRYRHSWDWLVDWLVSFPFGSAGRRSRSYLMDNVHRYATALPTVFFPL